MRFLLQIEIPQEPFNTLTREGTSGQKLGNILEETKPEAIYFTSINRNRGAVAIYNLENASDLPKVAEPWFLSFNARVDATVAMIPEDIKAAGLEDLGKKWK